MCIRDSPIIGSGKNACVLHYLENHDTCEDGQMLLMDVASRYANYNSDLTRTVPVNGRFTDRQRAVYDAVLRTMRACNEMLRPGVILKDYQEEVGKLVQSELLQLELISQKDIDNQNPDQPAYKKYFMHGTSHHMGLDTHDFGVLKEPMVANMVFTVEPGIYIQEEKMGIRLEDDVVIQTSGAPMNLMKNIPNNIKVWPAQEAVGLNQYLKKFNKDKDKVTFQTGYGPSGLPHIGTFGEVMRTSMVMHSFEKLYGIKTNLLCFSDDLDGLRKVPDNIPNKELVERDLDLPLSKVTDPFGTHKSFADHNNSKLCEFLDSFNFDYNFISSTIC